VRFFFLAAKKGAAKEKAPAGTAGHRPAFDVPSSPGGGRSGDDTDEEAAGIKGRCWGGWAANSSACAPVNGYAVLRTMSNA
jgi:hypothetical protein